MSIDTYYILTLTIYLPLMRKQSKAHTSDFTIRAACADLTKQTFINT